MERQSLQIWIYSRDDKPLVSNMVGEILQNNSLIGSTYKKSVEPTFTHGGLVPAMQAAIRGEINLLLVTDYEMLGENSTQIESIINTFADYGVLVKSCSSLDSSIS